MGAVKAVNSPCSLCHGSKKAMDGVRDGESDGTEACWLRSDGRERLPFRGS